MWEMLIALLLGLVAGTITGLIPGLHTNLTTSLLITLYPTLALPPEPGIVFLCSLTLAHLYADYIPSILLGAPDENAFLAVLPGHELLQKGQALTAIYYAQQGVTHGILFALLLSPLWIQVLPLIAEKIEPVLPYLLLLLALTLIFRETLWHEAFLLAILASMVGLLTFSLPVHEPLVPLLGGLFGAAGLLTSLTTKQQLPPQEKTIQKEALSLPLKIKTWLIAPFFSFLPGIGSGHAATAIAESHQPSPKEFLYITGSTASIILVLSIPVLIALNKTRTGLAAGIDALLPTFTNTHYIIIVLTLILSIVLLIPLQKVLTQKAIKVLAKINYAFLTIGTLCILTGIVLSITNFLGMIVYLTATALGYCTISSGLRRITLMNALIIPAIVYYLLN